jgi:periplasmic copper chaperone A
MTLPVSRRALLAAALLTLASPVSAASGAISVAGAWSRPAAAGVNGAGYLTIVNAGRTPDTLVAVSSPVAARVTLHATKMSGGVMSMRPLADLAIPAGSTVALAPGGRHLMLEGLKRPLKVGDRFPVTLSFVHAGRMTVTFAVRAGADPMAGMHM